LETPLVFTAGKRGVTGTLWTDSASSAKKRYSIELQLLNFKWGFVVSKKTAGNGRSTEACVDIV